MTQEHYQIAEEKGAHVSAPYKKYYEQGKAASEGGKLKLVKEYTLEPYSGKGFELGKGQVVRYEIIAGAQILDCFYMVKSRPMEEWADTYHTSIIGAMYQSEGMHYFSNSPWIRPLLTFIRDTVDIEAMRKEFHEAAAHSYVFHSGACSSAIYEAGFGIANCNSCHVNTAEAMLEIAGEEVARRHIHPAAFMHFQPVAFAGVPVGLKYFPGRECIKVGDFVELLAHDDLLITVSACPCGDQHDMTDFRKYTCYPVRIAIYEGEDGPLETAPEPQRGTMNAVDFVLAGKPGMVTGKIGGKE